MSGDHAVGVCGFGRCGTTMAMAMLDAGGCLPLPGTNPGSYEFASPAEALDHPLQAFRGHSVKLLDEQTLGPLPDVAWRFVWLDRDPLQQAISALKLLIHTGVMDPPANTTQVRYRVERLVYSYRLDRPRYLGALRRVGPVTVLRYEDALAVPKRAAKALAKVWPDLDRQAAAAAVHDRDGGCLPDLAAEARIIGATP